MSLSKPKRVSLNELVRGHESAARELKKWAPGVFYCSKGDQLIVSAGQEQAVRSFEFSSVPDVAAVRAAKLQEGHLYEVISSKKGTGYSYKVRELPLNYFN